MEHIVIREREIRSKHTPPNGWNEESIRSVLERQGIDFGKTTYVRGDEPNREWTNARAMFMPTDAEVAANKAEAEAQEAILKAEKARHDANTIAMSKEIADLRNQLEKLSANQGISVVEPLGGLVPESLTAVPPEVEKSHSEDVKSGEDPETHVVMRKGIASIEPKPLTAYQKKHASLVMPKPKKRPKMTDPNDKRSRAYREAHGRGKGQATV